MSYQIPNPTNDKFIEGLNRMNAEVTNPNPST
jgi:hypothetical protein